LLSGGTAVALRVTKKHELLADVIDLSHIQELKIHTSTATHLVFGAGLSLEEVKALSQNTVPALYEALSVFGSRQIRCLATLGGNLGSGSPIGDTLPVLMASGAEVILQSTKGERVVPMSEFILGYRKTNRKPNELIRAIRIPRTDAHTLLKFYKVSKRKDLDISTVSACFRLHLNTGKVASLVLAYGGMAAVTKCASHAEAYLLGKNWDRTTVEHAMAEMEQDFTPLTDARSGAAFRMAAAKNLLLKFWSETNTLLKSA
jgi:xanthine dehydrogenase small subunit